MDLRHICPIAERKHLAVNRTTADHHGLFRALGEFRCCLRSMTDCKAGNLRFRSRQRHIHPSGQRLLAGEIIDGPATHDDHGAPGGFTEEFSVGA